MDNTLQGRFWMSKSQQNFLGKGRIELLLLIEETGSITKAAKMMKMSYKAAWDSVDIMNNLSEYPLVSRVKGGKGGGGTELTPYAKELITTYKILQEEHHNFLNNLSKPDFTFYHVNVNKYLQNKFIHNLSELFLIKHFND